MDTVFIEGPEVDTVIGAYDWERGIRQCLQLDLTLGWDIRPSAQNDELDKAPTTPRSLRPSTCSLPRRASSW